jgi:hypothetical protein
MKTLSKLGLGKFNLRVSNSIRKRKVLRRSAMQDGGRWRRLIYRRIAAFVIASAHIAVSRHLLATFHLGRRHGRIGQARKQRTASPQQNKKQRSDAPNAHITMLRRCANPAK